MRAADVMTSPVITIPELTPIPAAAALLASHGFTSAPVVDSRQRMVGIVTESDLVRGRIAPEGAPAGSVGLASTVSGVMTPDPLCGRPDDDLAEVVWLMQDGSVRSVPIVRDDELVGIVTRRDVLRVIARGEMTSEDVRLRRGGGEAEAGQARPATESTAAAKPSTQVTESGR
ncbi:MAG TPA: CBS domain-containing protein [Pseudonocardia sp.]|jgi:CBS domain-containing protein|nr:CBS domain-containing protein [Pseudonocardia sp.]